jgi:hypothetical protein
VKKISELQKKKTKAYILNNYIYIRQLRHFKHLRQTGQSKISDQKKISELKEAHHKIRIDQRYQIKNKLNY